MDSDHHQYECVVIFGPPGSGKGTLARVLCELGSVVHISSGDVIRHLPSDAKERKKLQDFAKRGELINDPELILSILLSHIQAAVPRSTCLLLDGFPRTLSQAKLMKEYFVIRGVIFMEVTDHKVLIERMQKRAKQEGRSDDELAIFKKRLSIFQEETLPLLSTFDQKIISRVNASQKPLMVLKDILNAVGHLIS